MAPWARHGTGGLGKRGQGGKRGVNQKRHNKGLQLWVRTGVSFSSGFASPRCFLGTLPGCCRSRGTLTGDRLQERVSSGAAIRYCSLGQLLRLLFSSHRYSLLLGLYEIIFQPEDNVRFSGIRTFMPNPINPRCSFYPSAYLIV